VPGDIIRAEGAIIRSDHHPHGVLWWKCRNDSLVMDALTGFVCAGVVTPVVAPSLRSVEPVTTDSGIAVKLAESGGGSNK
jgi:hypothetical protein